MHYSFLPRTIPDWNKGTKDLANCDLDPLRYLDVNISILPALMDFAK